MDINKIIKEILNEVRYLDTKAYNIPKEKPIKDTETIRVYHGFYSFDTALEVIGKGLSGKEKARRIYSYESGNNPYGLFVTTDFKVADNFASSGIIIEFTTKVSDLEAPVWVDGRSYFVQGEYTKSFKDLSDREKQRLINRQKAGESPYDTISKSDRPELADTLFDNPERQALYIGDLNPNMIKRVWYSESRHKERRYGPWEKYSVKQFISKNKIDLNKNKKRINFKPNDDFTIEKFSSFLDDDKRSLNAYIDQIIYDIDNDYTLSNYGFWPKQIKQIRDLHKKGYFDKYLNEGINFLSIKKIIKEESIKKIPPTKFSNEKIVEDIIEYLYNNNEYNIKNGFIKSEDYNDNDNKIKKINIHGKYGGPYTDNKFSIYPNISFLIIGSKNNYNIENIEILDDGHGLYKDIKNKNGYHNQKLKPFDKNFYNILKREIISNFRFDNKNNKFTKSKQNINDDYPIEWDLKPNNYRMDEGYVRYIEKLAKMDSNMFRRNKILKHINRIRKQNYYTTIEMYYYFEDYRKGNIK